MCRDRRTFVHSSQGLIHHSTSHLRQIQGAQGRSGWQNRYFGPAGLLLVFAASLSGLTLGAVGSMAIAAAFGG